ncbi:MAG: HEAT repeat domain-containing protein [Nitrospirae bacterium]|nr:MAG: HEAT repeat domain-containing protein [Nitrospirota bacterium]
MPTLLRKFRKEVFVIARWSLIGLILLALGLFWGEKTQARHPTFTPEQKVRLRQARVIAIRAIALTEQGAVDPQPLRDAVATRLRQFGYGVTNARERADVIVKVKCEERKTWTGTTRFGGDADQPYSPLRVWNGPACQLTYLLGTQPGPWEYEIRADFEDAMAAAQAAGADHPGRYALMHLRQKVAQSNFPVLLAAHWGQAERLAALLTDPATDQSLKRFIMEICGQLPDSTALMAQALTTVLHDPALRIEAILALGRLGEQALPTLLDLIERSRIPAVRAAAVRAVGAIGARTGTVDVVPQLLALLETPNLDLTVQIEAVTALGNIPDQRSIEPLEKIRLFAWSSRSLDPRIQRLQEAVEWSLWQIIPTAHTD